MTRGAFGSPMREPEYPGFRPRVQAGVTVKATLPDGTWITGTYADWIPETAHEPDPLLEPPWFLIDGDGNWIELPDDAAVQVHKPEGERVQP